MACVRFFTIMCMHVNTQYLRWAASAVVLALVALNVLHSWQPTQTDDAALLITGAESPLPAASPSIAAAPPTLPTASPDMMVVDVIGVV